MWARTISISCIRENTSKFKNQDRDYLSTTYSSALILRWQIVGDDMGIDTTYQRCLLKLLKRAVYSKCRGESMLRAAAKLMVTKINRQLSLKQWRTRSTVMLLTTISISGCGGRLHQLPPASMTLATLKLVLMPLRPCLAVSLRRVMWPRPARTARPPAGLVRTSIRHSLRSESPLQMAPPLLNHSG